MKNSSGPKIEGKYWLYPSSLTGEDRIVAIKIENGIMESYFYLTDDNKEAAETFTVLSGEEVKVGFLVLENTIEGYSVEMNEDGVSGVISIGEKSFKFKNLTEDSVVLCDGDDKEIPFYTMEKSGYPVKGVFRPKPSEEL